MKKPWIQQLSLLIRCVQSINRSREVIMENAAKKKNSDLISWIQKITKEKEGRDILCEEAREGANNLVGFFDLLFEIDKRNNDKYRKSQKINKKL